MASFDVRLAIVIFATIASIIFGILFYFITKRQKKKVPEQAIPKSESHDDSNVKSKGKSGAKSFFQDEDPPVPVKNLGPKVQILIGTKLKFIEKNPNEIPQQTYNYSHYNFIPFASYEDEQELKPGQAAKDGILYEMENYDDIKETVDFESDEMINDYLIKLKPDDE